MKLRMAGRLRQQVSHWIRASSPPLVSHAPSFAEGRRGLATIDHGRGGGGGGERQRGGSGGRARTNMVAGTAVAAAFAAALYRCQGQPGRDGLGEDSASVLSEGIASYDYIIVGSGLAAAGGLRGIRSVDGSAQVLVLAWDPDARFSGRRLEEVSDAHLKRVTVRSEAAVKLDADGKRVTLQSGETVAYTKGCLLATGSERPNIHVNEISDDAKDRIFTSTGGGGSIVPADLSKLLKQHEEHNLADEPHVTVLGGGQQSCLMASEIARTGVSVSMAMEDPGPMSTVLPHYLSMHVMWCMRRLGIQVIPYTTLEYVRGTRSYDNRTTTSTAASTSNSQVDGLDIYLGRTFNRMDARRYRTDAIVIIPSAARGEASLASPRENGVEEAQTEKGGFAANCELCIRSGVYTAGDAASLPHPILGRVGLRGQDHARISGELAGRNMASGGGGERYSALPFFDESTIGPQGTELGLKIEAVGLPDSGLVTVAFWEMGRWSPSPAAAASVALPSGPTAPEPPQPKPAVGAAPSRWSSIVGIAGGKKMEVGAPEKAAVPEAAGAGPGGKEGVSLAKSRPSGAGRGGKEEAEEAEGAEEGVSLVKSRTSGAGPGSYVGYRSGVVYYLGRTGHVVGIVLLNMPPESREAAREIILKGVMLPTSKGGLPTTEHGSVLGNPPMDYGESLRDLVPVKACDSGRRAILKMTMPRPGGKRGTGAKGSILGAKNDKWTTAIFGTVQE